MGVWSDRKGQVLVANIGEKTIQEVDVQGQITTIARVQSPWAPSGMLRDRVGKLWILEYSTTNQARVRRIDPEGRAQAFWLGSGYASTPPPSCFRITPCWRISQPGDFQCSSHLPVDAVTGQLLTYHLPGGFGSCLNQMEQLIADET